MALQFSTDEGPLAFTPAQMIVAGWTGRDRAAVQHHIDELADIGVPPPSQVPLYYRVARSLLTQSPMIEVLGPDTSGEAEPLLLRQGGVTWIGLGSDHTDRALEAHSVAASKQICAKPCAADLWRFEEVADHLDQITIRSWIWVEEAWRLYQDGNLSQILPLTDLMAALDWSDGTAMLCGTFPAIGGIQSADQFRATMHDPVHNREITLTYRSTALPQIA